MATKTRRLADFLANIDDDSRVTSAGLLDATITASDLAPNSVDSSELVDGAVDTSHIGDLQVTAGKVAANAVTSAKIADANITAAKLSSTALASVEHVKPHIQPGTLYPAVEGFLEDNTQYTFTDYSANGLAVTPHGTGVPRHVTSQKKNHSTSIKLNGADDYITVADDADFDWGTGDFTVELWFMPYGALGTAEVLLASNNSGTTDSEFYLRSESGRLNWARGADNLSGGTSDFNTLDTWYHVAFVNASGTITCYKNGTALYNFSAGSHDYNPTDGFSIGARKTSGAYAQWGQYYIDDVRVVKGLAVYTGNFTAPTGPLTATWSANPFGGSNTAANADANKIACLVQSNPTGLHSGAYGTAQSTGRKYYYTDILGSKPIKDPRIGAHFWSQRYKTTSLQLLEQETATHGSSVYSVDGREWCRFASNTVSLQNGSYGNYISTTVTTSTDEFLEIVCYANGLNFLIDTWTQQRHFTWAVNGGDATTNTDFLTAESTPLGGRFVGAASVANVFTEQTLGINTIRISKIASHYLTVFGFELIAQDIQDFTATNATNILTSAGHTLTNGDQIRLTGADLPNGLNATTTYFVVGVSGNNFQVSATLGGSAVTFSDDGSGTRTFRALNNIQIPAQNVISYGKKFSVSATAQHYNPFAFKTDGATAWASGAHNGTSWPVGTGASANIDTTTSLGLENWKHSNNYYKPYNGGRVVKWIASDGTIKTSVNVMPPNARNNNSTAINEKANASIANNTYLPTFSTGADNSLSEIAKIFHFREFGNGSANQGAGGAYADASKLDGYDDISFVMDDGLTALSANDVNFNNGIHLQSDNDSMFFTFIGTGLAVKTHAGTHGGTDDFRWYVDGVEVRSFKAGYVHTGRFIIAAQNLSYGTHVFKVQRTTANTFGQILKELTFHQPKMPPIPDDAVVLADYMLMADFVPIPIGDAHINLISKGTRRVYGSRDCFYDETASAAIGAGHYPENTPGGYEYTHSAVNAQNRFRVRCPSFATNFVAMSYQAATRADVYIENTEKTGSDIIQNTAGSYGSHSRLANDEPLGVQNWGVSAAANGNLSFWAFDLVTPTHTSSHYQSFETPFLKELVGGDKNMEQSNLIVTPDGKSWHEVTRKTDYLGNVCIRADRDGAVTTASSTIIMDEYRGAVGGQYNVDLGGFIQKDFAIGYSNFVCLVDGEYRIEYETVTQSGQSAHTDIIIYVNGISRARGTAKNADNYNTGATVQMTLKRGDNVSVQGIAYASPRQWFYITRTG